MIADALDPVDPYIEDILIAFRAFKRTDVRDEEYQEVLAAWEAVYGKVHGGKDDDQNNQNNNDHNNSHNQNNNHNNGHNNGRNTTPLPPVRGDAFEEEMYQLALRQKEDEERKRQSAARKKHEGRYNIY